MGKGKEKEKRREKEKRNGKKKGKAGNEKCKGKVERDVSAVSDVHCVLHSSP